MNLNLDLPNACLICKPTMHKKFYPPCLVLKVIQSEICVMNVFNRYLFVQKVIIEINNE